MISNNEVNRFGKVHKFYVCLSQSSNGRGLREWVMKEEEKVTFLNRSECSETFGITDTGDNIKMIETVISKVPTHSVIVFDEVPLSSRKENKSACYDWSLLHNKRPEEVTAVVCLQPIRIAPVFRQKTHHVICPKDADVIQLTNQYRSTTNIAGFVNQLREEKLSIEYTDTGVFPSHDVKGPDVTAISITDQSQAADLRIWLCNQLQREMACKPCQVKMIHVDSTKSLAEKVFRGTVYEKSLISQDDFQGCETPIGVAFLGTDNTNLSQVLEMCSRAKYKLILVANAKESLHEEVISTRGEITVLNIAEVDKLPALVTATANGNITCVRQLLDCGANVNDDNAGGPLVKMATEQGNASLVRMLLQAGACVNDDKAGGLHLVKLATEQGDFDIVSQLIKHGASFVPQERDPNKKSLLIIAVEKGNASLVRVLLQAGASINEDNAGGLHLVKLATEQEDVDIVSQLIKHGARVDPGEHDPSKITPLIIAVKKGNAALVKILLQGGANIKRRNSNGLTPLAIARANGFDDIVRQIPDFEWQEQQQRREQERQQEQEQQQERQWRRDKRRCDCLRLCVFPCVFLGMTVGCWLLAVSMVGWFVGFGCGLVSAMLLWGCYMACCFDDPFSLQNTQRSGWSGLGDFQSPLTNWQASLTTDPSPC